MRAMKIAGVVVLALGMIAGVELTSLSQTTQSSTNTPSETKQIGSIKSITGSTIVLAPDAGPDLNVLVQDSTRIVRITPGEKDLRNAVPLTVHDLEAGDRILVRGRSPDPTHLIAGSILAMKHADIEERQEKERDAWQKSGVAGIVDVVDPEAGNIKISIVSLAGKKTVSIVTTKTTIMRRYAPDSVRFDDAKPGTIAEIKAGDQLRARGIRSTDGAQLSADEIVSGTFRNIAGSVGEVDASSGTIRVVDSATRKPVLVRVTADSELRSLPPEMAQRIALRFGGGSPPGAPAHGEFRREAPVTAGSGGPPSAPQRRGDIQQLFNRLPALKVSDMKKGDVVMLVATEGGASGTVTAIKLLNGVEPLLAATSKKDGEQMTLSPWSLGGQGGEDATP